MNNIKLVPIDWQGKYTGKFAELLKNLKTPAKVFIVDMDVPERTFYNWRQGHYAFPPDLAGDLYRACQYQEDRDEILDFFCDEFGLLGIHRFESTPNGNDVKDETLKLGQWAGKAFEMILKTLEDGRVDDDEYKADHRTLNRIRAIVATIDEKLRAMAQGQVMYAKEG